MPHFLELTRSFVENIGDLDDLAQTEIGAILRELDDAEDVTDYTPKETDYAFERDGSGFCGCSHPGRWGGWVLTWYPEIGFTSKAIRIWVSLDQRDETWPIDLVRIPWRGPSW